MTNYEYIMSKNKVEKTSEQIIREFRAFCSNRKGCNDCPFDEFCTAFTYNQLYKWLTKEYDKSEWITDDDLK